MRCQTVHSLFRGLVTAGLLVSTQSALLHASWKDRLHPSLGTCFLHDLHWDQSRIATPQAVRVAAVQELDLCLAAAKRFEIQAQVEAIFADLKPLHDHLSTGNRLFANGSRAKAFLISWMEQSALRLVQWIKVSDALPVTAIVTQEDDGFDDDWNCGDWSNTGVDEHAIRLPKRDGGNLFVYAINFDPDSLCDPNAGNHAAHEWQVGVDAVCPEIQSRNATPSWIDSLSAPSVCCPLEDTATEKEEAISTETISSDDLSAIRPPILELTYDDSEALLPSDWQAIASNDVFDFDAPIDAGTQSQLDVKVSPYAIEEKYERTNPTTPDPTSRWLSSLGVVDWALHVGKGYTLGSFEPTWPESIRPLSQFSIEDLIAPSKTRALLFGTLRETRTIDTVEEKHFETRSLNAVASPSPSQFADPTAAEPLAAELYSAEPIAAETPRGNIVSKYLASRLRSVAMVLLDFASKIESTDQIEVASGTSQSVR